MCVFVLDEFWAERGFFVNEQIEFSNKSSFCLI